MRFPFSAGCLASLLSIQISRKWAQIGSASSWHLGRISWMVLPQCLWWQQRCEAVLQLLPETTATLADPQGPQGSGLRWPERARAGHWRERLDRHVAGGTHGGDAEVDGAHGQRRDMWTVLGIQGCVCVRALTPMVVYGDNTN